MTTLQRILQLKALGIINMKWLVKESGIPYYIFERKILKQIEFDEKQGAAVMAALGRMLDKLGGVVNGEKGGGNDK